MNLIINHTSMEPIYEQIVAQIKAEVIEGTLTAGEALPSVRALSRELKISALTVKKAYDNLEEEGLVVTVHGKGSFISAANQELLMEERRKELEKELGITLFFRNGKGVTLTNDGSEFLLYARQIYGEYETVLEKYGKNGNYKKKFGVSTQHYSFAVKAFVDMAKEFDMSKYEFAIRETRTAEVIQDVSTMKSEIGVLYLSDYNRKAMEKLLNNAGLEFHHLIDCQAYVYLWKHHPLANEESISFEQLEGYPCLSFEQGDNSSFYLA